MSVESPPIFIQAGGETAERARRALHAFAGLRGGIVASGDLAVTENGTPNMSVNVATGQVLIPGTEGTYQGVYMVENRGTLNVTIAAADATNARKDLIVAKVQDSAYSGATDAASIVAVTGTPAASPAEPSVPENAWVLAMVDVPATDTAITDSQITDRRTQQTSPSQAGQATALGGIVVCTSSTRPGSPTEGMAIYETDTDRLLTYDGAAWVRIAHASVAGRTGCRLRRAAAQSIPDSSATSISWDTEDQDTDGFIAVTATTITIPSGLGGLYAITASIVPASSVNNRMLVDLALTSAITGMSTPLRNEGNTPSTRGSGTWVIPLLAADSFTVQIFHTHGSAKDFTAWLSCYRMGA
jgi:hypothetical protein